VAFPLTIIITYLSGVRGPVIMLMNSLPIIFIAVIAFYLRRDMVDIWHSQRRIIRARAMDLLDPLNVALKDGGFEPVARRSGATLFFAEEGTTFDLKDGLNLTLVDAGARTVLFLGPDRDGTRRDVEAVKGIVDTVLDAREARPSAPA